MKLLLVYPPFCTPSIMPYSISNIEGYLKANLDIEVKCLDLNAKFHHLRFKEIYAELRKDKTKGLGEVFFKLLERFDTESRPIYSENNKKVRAGEAPDCYEELLALILKEKPDAVAFSLVYNSQCFYAKALMDGLAQRKIDILIGGPADTSKLSQEFTFIHDEFELSAYLQKNKGVKLRQARNGKTGEDGHIPDFGDYDKADYLSKETIIPIRASSGCCYRQCTFCTHHQHAAYKEADLMLIKKAIVASKAKHFFFIDDMIHTTRLMETAKLVKPLKIKWACQLRPTKDLLGKFPELYDSGIRSIFYGVESGSPRVLKLMKKGTNPKDVSAVLRESHEAGIRNTAFIMFGFPGETKDEFLETIQFLKDNSAYLDLISTSVFGLQKGSYIYEHPEEFGISKITEDDRALLSGTISYTLKAGPQHEESRRFGSRHMKEIKLMEKLPRVMNYFKEQIMLVDK